MSLLNFKEKDVFAMAALDHRQTLKKLLGASAKKTLIAWKKEALIELAETASGVLLDIEYGLPAYRQLQLKKPFWLAMEASGWTGTENNRQTQITHSAKEIKKIGAGGAKLLVYYNPTASSAKLIRQQISKTAKDCQQEKIPFLLEIVTYQIKKEVKDNLILRSLNEIKKTNAAVDVWKLEFPGKTKTASGRKQAAEKCREITGVLKETPWILLSAGKNFNVFKQQVDIATANGAAGFLAGRALWQDFKKYKDRKKFFTERARKRLEEIKKIAIENTEKRWWQELFR